MAGYSNTPLFKKLGYKNGMKVYAFPAPKGYLKLLSLPEDIEPVWVRSLQKGLDLMHVFTTKRTELSRFAKEARSHLAPAGAVWVSWPKKSSGVETDITEDVMREVILPLGLVDIKVCAVDETWSGLKCVIRRELR